MTAVVHPVFNLGRSKVEKKNIAVDDDERFCCSREVIGDYRFGKEIVSRCLELRLTIDKRLEAEGGFFLDQGLT